MSNHSTSANEIPRRQLGRTGVEVSCVGLGGSHIGKKSLTSREAVKIMQAALDRGITFMDNSWDYNDGESERRMGRALKGNYRAKAFLMTKIDGRSKKEAHKQLDESLSRLKVDYIDLLQHHEVIRFDDVDRIFGAEGAMEAFIEAREQGKIRFFGFTGHKHPVIHLHMLQAAEAQGVRMDAVQMPLNVCDAHYRSFEQAVLPQLVAQQIGVLGMKSMGGGAILKSNKVTPVECLQYALNLPTSVVITGIDSMEILDQAVETASRFQTLSAEEVSALLAKTADTARDGKYELFKTTTLYDSTVTHPKWLGEETERHRELVGD